MKQGKVLKLAPGWWKDGERQPADDLVIKKAKRAPSIPKFFTVKEIAGMLRCGVDFVYDIIKAKKLDAQPVGGKYLIAETALHEYLERERHSRVG